MNLDPARARLRGSGSTSLFGEGDSASSRMGLITMLPPLIKTNTLVPSFRPAASARARGIRSTQPLPTCISAFRLTASILLAIAGKTLKISPLRRFKAWSRGIVSCLAVHLADLLGLGEPYPVEDCAAALLEAHGLHQLLELASGQPVGEDGCSLGGFFGLVA